MSRLTDEELEAILRAHHHTEADPGASGLAMVALAHSGTADEKQNNAAAEALRAQPELAETLLALSSLEARGIVPPLARGRFFNSRKLTAVGFAVAAAIVVFSWSPIRPPESNTLSPKGGVEELALAVERGGQRFTARPGDRLVTGDRLGLFYSAPEPGFLAIVHRDQKANVTALFPARAAKSAAIDAGLHIAAPDGAVVEEGTGCEWFIAVFSAQPLRIAELSQIISKTSTAGEGCDLPVDVAGTRAVRVFAVQRGDSAP
jgi:hypothetical protein